MRVLMLSWEYPPHVIGGLGKHVEELLPALAGLGSVSVDLVTPNWRHGEARSLIGDRVQVIRVPPPNPGADILQATRAAAAALVEAALRRCPEGGYDLIHAHDWLVGEAARELQTRLGLPLVVTIHATERGRNQGAIPLALSRSIDHIENLLAQSADAVVACSEYMADQIAEYLRCPLSAISVIPNGVDPSRFTRIDPTGLAEFRRWFAAPDELLVLYVGRLVREKGVHVLVETMPRVLAGVPQAKLVVAGTGPEAEDLREMANRLGVGTKSYFTGFVPDDIRDRLYKVADVAVFPSLYEPFGIVALEAMAAGAPVIATATGGFSEVIRHLDNGLTAHRDSVESLSWAMVEALSDPFAARARGLRAFEMVLERYNWHHLAQETVDLYHSVLAARGRIRKTPLLLEKTAVAARSREKKRHGPSL